MGTEAWRSGLASVREFVHTSRSLVCTERYMRAGNKPCELLYDILKRESISG